MNPDEPEEVETPADNAAQAQDSNDAPDATESAQAADQATQLGTLDPSENVDSAESESAAELPTQLEDGEQAEIPAEEDVAEDTEDNSLEAVQDAENDDPAQAADPIENVETNPSDLPEEVPVSLDDFQQAEEVNRADFTADSLQRQDADPAQASDAPQDPQRERSEVTEIPDPVDEITSAETSDNQETLGTERTDQEDQPQVIEEGEVSEQTNMSQRSQASEESQRTEPVAQFEDPEEAQTSEVDQPVKEDPEAIQEPDQAAQSLPVDEAPDAEDDDSLLPVEEAQEPEKSETPEKPDEDRPEKSDGTQLETPLQIEKEQTENLESTESVEAEEQDATLSADQNEPSENSFQDISENVETEVNVPERLRDEEKQPQQSEVDQKFEQPELNHEQADSTEEIRQPGPALDEDNKVKKSDPHERAKTPEANDRDEEPEPTDASHSAQTIRESESDDRSETVDEKLRSDDLLAEKDDFIENEQKPQTLDVDPRAEREADSNEVVSRDIDERSAQEVERSQVDRDNLKLAESSTDAEKSEMPERTNRPSEDRPNFSERAEEDRRPEKISEPVNQGESLERHFREPDKEQDLSLPVADSMRTESDRSDLANRPPQEKSESRAEAPERSVDGNVRPSEAQSAAQPERVAERLYEKKPPPGEQSENVSDPQPRNPILPPDSQNALSADDLKRNQAEKAAKWEAVQKAENEAVAEGGELFSRYAQQAFQRFFSETPALLRLWNEAKTGANGQERVNSRDGFNATRDEFWAMVRDPENQDGQIVQNILKLAGFSLSNSGAPVLTIEERTESGKKAAKYSLEEIRRRLITEVNMGSRGKELTAQQSEGRLKTSLSLDIDHANPASLSDLWLDPKNMQFMFGDDNRYHKGNRYGADGKLILKKNDKNKPKAEDGSGPRAGGSKNKRRTKSGKKPKR